MERNDFQSHVETTHRSVVVLARVPVGTPGAAVPRDTRIPSFPTFSFWGRLGSTSANDASPTTARRTLLEPEERIIRRTRGFWSSSEPRRKQDDKPPFSRMEREGRTNAPGIPANRRRETEENVTSRVPLRFRPFQLRVSGPSAYAFGAFFPVERDLFRCQAPTTSFQSKAVTTVPWT